MTFIVISMKYNIAYNYTVVEMIIWQIVMRDDTLTYNIVPLKKNNAKKVTISRICITVFQITHQ